MTRMKSAVLRFLTTLGALLAAQTLIDGAALRKVWEIRLEGIVKEAVGSGPVSSHTVNAIRFSPDELRLAVVVDIHSTATSYSSHLLILETKSPRAPSQFELEQGVLPTNDEDAGLLWSPEGNSITVAGAIISLKQGRLCTSNTWGASVGGYLNSQMLVARMTPGHLDREHPSERFILFDLGCVLQDTWNVDNNWLIRDVSPDRGLSLVHQFRMRYSAHLFERPRGETLLVDFRQKQVLRRWSADELVPSEVRFAEGGKTFCAAAGGVRPYAVPLRCADVDTGKIIAEASGVERAWSIVIASKSSRVVIAQYRPQPDDKPATPVLDRRIVWDFRTGQQVAAWHPEFQTWLFPSSKMTLRRKNPFVFAISPSGKYISEGGNGVLRLYEIEP